MGAPATHSRRPLPPTVTLSEEQSHDLVYFSSVSQNTHRFVQRLARPAVRIPLHPRITGQIQVCKPYVLIVPTYGGGEESGAIPRQVADFLNNRVNRSFIRGVITSGNRNFGKYFCLAGPIISRKCQVPELYRFELLGTNDDVKKVNQGLDQFWQTLKEERNSA
ncbi:MAG: class Ib ribonucleoside-diphosphate reductase assembly flavoprotein NrdI [Actinomycetaceae bacterium]|nr:class Ib ribonucleoside-diphosphate reductase assembly flavoprotein NrdI [Actinomycetaceae bacterium]